MMNPKLDIQQATPAEMAEVVALVDAAYTKWIEVLGGKPMPMTTDYAPLIAQQYVYSIREGSELVAVLVIWPEEDTFYIDNIAVSPAHQGRGIGAQLMAFAEQQARALNLPRITLMTNIKMEYNQAYYIKHGYVEIHREVLPNGRIGVWMQKQL